MQPNNSGYQPAVSRSASIYDAGLKAHMQSVYNRMTVGVFITGIVAYFVGNSPALLNFFLGGPQAYIVMLAPLAIIWFGFRPERMAPSQLKLTFGILSVIYGISFATIFAAYTTASIAQAFFMATALFAGLSIFGYVTKKNLDGLGTFAVMGVIGVLVLSLGTMVAGMFGVDTSMMQTVIAGLGLLVFSGLTAWETQTTKEMYSAGNAGDANSRMAWAAALNLYLSFIMLFQYIMHFVDNRE